MTEHTCSPAREYTFEDYLLRRDGILVFKEEEIHIPPKELEVFTLLLDAGGRLVTKEKIFNHVWQKYAASDESLTRCIYVLRQLLGEKKNSRYIETVYGKGYRFRPAVSVITHTCRSGENKTVAVFPFRTRPHVDESFLHHEIIQHLSRQLVPDYDILPAVVTQDCKDFSAISALTSQLRPEYYFTGKLLTEGPKRKIFIEIVQASTHKLIENYSLEINPQMNISSMVSHIVSALLARLPDIALRRKLDPTTSLQPRKVFLW